MDYMVSALARHLTGVGPTRAIVIARAFPTVYAMAVATEAEWAAVPGLGPRLANRIWRSLRGDHTPMALPDTAAGSALGNASVLPQ
jgi:NAD-dependent DNA ligase